MKVIGEHRKQLIDLLIYYLNKDNYGVNHNFINEENPTGRYWVKCYIDSSGVKVKHRELLVELLIYYMNKDNHNYIQFANFINEEDPTGRYWITAYIDDYVDRMIPWKQTYKQTK